MGFLAKGKQTEMAFSKILSNVKFSSENEDITEHWDISTNIKIDVKGLKKRNRSDDTVDERIHWVEIKNVNGNVGWLYGDADYFAFELHDYWIVVDKYDLQLLVKSQVKKEYSNIPMLNKLYTREGRKDVMTLISTFDLINIATSYVKK
jgi:hypothetical protein